MRFPRMSELRLPLAAFALVVLIYCCLPGRLIRTHGIWINDEGNRMLQIEALAENHGAVRDPLNGDYPAGLTPYVPGGFFTVHPESGKIISAYSPVFASLSVPFWKAGGFTSVRVMVLFFGLVAVLLTGIAAFAAGLNRYGTAAVIFLAGAGTPLLFYSGTMFEHTLAASAAAGSLLCAVFAFRYGDMKYWCFAGLLAGLVVWFREEGCLLFAGSAAALALCRVRWKNGTVFAAGFLLAVLPLWITNWIQWHDVFGIHHIVYKDIAGPAMSLADRGRSVLFFLFRSNTSGIAASALALIFAGSLVFGFVRDDRPMRHQVKAILLVLISVAALTNLFFLINWSGHMENTLEFQSVCGFAPFVILPAVFFRVFWNDENRFWRFLAVTDLLSFAGIAVLLEFNNRGIFFGPRHFILPVLFSIPLTMHLLTGKTEISPETMRIIRIAAYVFCICAVVSQLCGMPLLMAKKQWTENLVTYCEKQKPSLLVTDAFYAPEELAGLPRNIPVLYLTGDPAGAGNLTSLADRNKLDRIYLLSSDRFSSCRDVFPLLVKDWEGIPMRCFRDDRVRFMQLTLYRLDRRKAENERKQ